MNVIEPKLISRLHIFRRESVGAFCNISAHALRSGSTNKTITRYIAGISHFQRHTLRHTARGMKSLAKRELQAYRSAAQTNCGGTVDGSVGDRGIVVGLLVRQELLHDRGRTALALLQLQSAQQQRRTGGERLSRRSQKLFKLQKCYHVMTRV